MKVTSQIKQANIAAAQAKAQGAALSANATLADMQARAAEKAGAYEEAKLARQKKAALSKQQALYSKSGVRFLSGSPLEVMADTATEFEMDIAASRYNVATEVAQRRYEAEYLRTTGRYYKGPLAKAYKGAGYTRAGATILTGGYGVARAWPS